MTDEQDRIATLIERYGARVVAGPPKGITGPVNHNVEDAVVAVEINKHMRALAGMVRAGFDAEPTWPAVAKED